MQFRSAGGPSSGHALHPLALPGRVVNRTGGAVVKGQVMALDLPAGETETTSYDPRDGAASVWGAGVAPTAATIAHGIHVIALEGAADNAVVRVAVQGIVDGVVVRGAGSGTVSSGDPLVVDTSGNLDATTAAGERYFAMFLQADTTVTAIGVDNTADATATVIFNGIGGFGVNHGT